jgi:hypothetical protein
LCANFAAKCVRIDVIDEGSLPVDLDDGKPLPVPLLEVPIAADVHLLELERDLGASFLQHTPCPLAEVAAGGVVERDARYGYMPRVVVASATRRTARP